jgi:hypothetical protein
MKYILSLIILFSCLFSYSQVEFKASVNYNKVAINEVFTFELSSNVQGQIYQPDFNDLQIVGGPIQSSSSSVMVVNGKRQAIKNLKFTWKIRANKKGKFIIPPTLMQYNGQEHKTKSITIVVSEASQTKEKVNATSDFFVRISASKKNVYLGEPFVVTLKMYSRQSPRGIENLKLGESNGIIKNDLYPNKTNYETKSENINGVNYYTIVLKKELCYAQTIGSVKIESYYISALFQRGFFQQYRQEGNSNTLNITVKEMPGKKPKNFNGLVGDFDLTHSISKTTIKVNEAIDIKIKISGNGNLNLFDDPVLDLPNDFDQFDPEIKRNIKKASSGTSGNISFNFVIVPTFYGDFEIPAYSFSYFDLKEKKYKTLTTGAFKIHVDKPDGEVGEIIKQKKDIAIEETDIRFIHKNNLSTFENSELKANSFLHYILIILPFIGLSLLLYFRNKNNNRSDADKIKMTSKSAKKSINKYLVESKKLHQAGKDDDAVKELSSALRSYLKKKLNLSESDLNKNHILNHLKEEKTSALFSKCWQTIEMYQYTPVNATQIDILINDTEELINLIDK